jgi:hypothetical protein
MLGKFERCSQFPVRFYWLLLYSKAGAFGGQMDSLGDLRRLLCQLRAENTTKKPDANQRKAQVAATIAKLQAIQKREHSGDQ